MKINFDYTEKRKKKNTRDDKPGREKKKAVAFESYWINCMRVEETVMSIYYWLLGW